MSDRSLSREARKVGTCQVDDRDHYFRSWMDNYVVAPDDLEVVPYPNNSDLLLNRLNCRLERLLVFRIPASEYGQELR